MEEHLLPTLLTTASSLGVEGLEDTQVETTETSEDVNVVDEDDRVPALPIDLELEELEAANARTEYNEEMREIILPTDSNMGDDDKVEDVSEEVTEDDSDAIIKKYSEKLKAASLEETQGLLTDEQETTTETIHTLETEDVSTTDVLEMEVVNIYKERPDNFMAMQHTSSPRPRQPRIRNDLEAVSLINLNLRV